MTAIAPTLMLAFLLALSLPGMCDPTTGFSGVTGMTLTCTRSTGANEAIAVNAPQSVGFSIKVNGKADAKLRGDVALTRLNGPRYEWKSYFTSTDAAGSKTVTTSFPGGGTIPNAVGSYKFQASLRQRDGTTITSNIITVIVYKVQCVKIEATHNEKIFWPTTPHFDDRLWVADSRVFAETGNLKVVFDRKRVADIMRPSPQYYRLNFTLQRYPACNTSQKLVTEVSVISTGPPATTPVNGWTSPYIWVATSPKIGRRAYDLHFTFKVNARPVNTTPQRVPGFVDYAIYGKPLCAQDSFTNERLHYACGWGAGSSTIACDGKDSIPWVVHNNIKTAGYTFTFRANPWMLLYQQGDCDTHANLMKDVLAILGVPATTTRIAPSGPSTRNSCGIPEHYRYGNVEQKRFRYDNGGNPVYVNWHAVCTVKTADKGIIHYDIIGHRAYGTPAQMTDEDEDRTKADFKNDVINGDIGWVYDLKDNQRGVCPVP